MHYFARGQSCRADRRENLHDGRALSRTWVSPLFMAISLGVSKWGGSKCFFGEFVFERASLTCVINKSPLKQHGSAIYQWILFIAPIHLVIDQIFMENRDFFHTATEMFSLEKGRS